MTKTESLLPLHPKDYLVLFSLAHGERHGYGLSKDIEKETDGLVRFDPSNLYRSIKRLIAQGLVASADERNAPDADNQRRRHYRITDFGRQVLQAETARMRKLADAFSERNLIHGGGGQG